MMYLRIGAILVMLSVLTGGYYKWNSMQDTIKQQNVTIQNYVLEVGVLKSNVKLNKEIAEQVKEQAVSEAVNEQKKIQLEMRMEYDKKISYGLESTRFYLSY